MAYGTVPWSDIAYVVVQSVVYAWLFNNSGGSVLLVMLFHTTNNVVSGGFFHAMFSGADWVRMGWLLVALWCAVASPWSSWVGRSTSPASAPSRRSRRPKAPRAPLA